MAAASTAPGGHKPTLTGAGSTFDAPFFSAAFARYQQQHPGVTIGYSAVGSSAGIAAISARQVDFGASDVAMTASEQAAAKGGPITRVPVALGGEGIVYNLSLPGGARPHLTGPVLAAIFLGQVTRWNDPALRAIWAAAAAIILLAVGACTSTTTTGTSASAVAVASTGPGGHKPTLTGARSIFDTPFFAAALSP